jgi:hypothetical protein
MREQRCAADIGVRGQREYGAERKIPTAAKTFLQLALFLAVALPAQPQQKTEDLTGRSSEDLRNIEATSVSKKQQKISKVMRGVCWETAVHFVDRLPASRIASYTRADTPWTWRLAETIEFGLVG